MNRFAAEITRNARGRRRRSVPDRENVPSRPTDAGFDAVRKAPQVLGTPEIRLPKRPKPGSIVNIAGGGRQRAVIWGMSDYMSKVLLAVVMDLVKAPVHLEEEVA